jgi:tetratricopeptide (TPR) repeat protein
VRNSTLDEKQLRKLCDLASRAMNRGSYHEALSLVNQIKNLGSHYLISHVVGALLIDIGTAVGKIDLIEKGKQLILKDLEKITSDAEYAQAAHYNLANAYSAISNLEVIKNPRLLFFKGTNLDSAKLHFLKALELKSTDRILTTQILVNLGNCYDKLGRVVDALECYDQALNLKKDFGMALGNKGISLLRYAVLCGEHQGTFILEAYSLLKSAQNSGVYAEARDDFISWAKLIEERYSKNCLASKLSEVKSLRRFSICSVGVIFTKLNHSSNSCV